MRVHIKMKLTHTTISKVRLNLAEALSKLPGDLEVSEFVFDLKSKPDLTRPDYPKGD